MNKEQSDFFEKNSCKTKEIPLNQCINIRTLRIVLLWNKRYSDWKGRGKLLSYAEDMILNTENPTVHTKTIRTDW